MQRDDRPSSVVAAALPLAVLRAPARPRSLIKLHVEALCLGPPGNGAEVRPSGTRRPGRLLDRKNAAARRADTIVSCSGRIQSTACGAPHDGTGCVHAPNVPDEG